MLNHYSVIVTFYRVSITIYIKGRKSTNGRLEKKNVATVATEPLGIVAIVQKRKKEKKKRQSGSPK